MAQWRISDLSKLTKISPRALRHYDQLGLLKPSVRMANGYRVYSEGDLVKLQQIIALKTFGFDLTRIKTALASKQLDVHANLSQQAHFLKQKGESLVKAALELEKINTKCQHDEAKSCSWESIIKSMRTYTMMNEAIETQVANLDLTVEQKAAYVAYAEDVGPKMKAIQFDAKEHLHEDPVTSEAGQRLGKQYFELIMQNAGDETIYDVGMAMQQAALSKEKELSKEQADLVAVLQKDLMPTIQWLAKAMQGYMLKKTPQVPSLDTVSSAQGDAQKVEVSNSAANDTQQSLSDEEVSQFFAAQKALIAELSKHLAKDPCGKIGQDAAQKWLDHMQKYAKTTDHMLQTRKELLMKHYMTMPKEFNIWMSKAMQCFMKNKQ